MEKPIHNRGAIATHGNEALSDGERAAAERLPAAAKRKALPPFRPRLEGPATLAPAPLPATPDAGVWSAGRNAPPVSEEATVSAAPLSTDTKLSNLSFVTLRGFLSWAENEDAAGDCNLFLLFLFLSFSWALADTAVLQGAMKGGRHTPKHDRRPHPRIAPRPPFSPLMAFSKFDGGSALIARLISILSSPSRTSPFPLSPCPLLSVISLEAPRGEESGEVEC